jgi:hypothetical protein
VSARWRRTLVVRKGQQRPPARTETAGPETLALLLDDVRDLRLTLIADLSAAAAAVEAGCEPVAAEILESDRQELVAFLRRSSTRFSALDGPDAAPDDHPDDDADVIVPSPRSWRRRVVISLPAVPLVGAIAMSAAAAEGLPQLPTHSAPGHVHVLSEGAAPVSSTFQQFETVLAGDPSASQVVAAASALHQQIEAMIARAPQSPGGVNEVARLLQLEQALLLRKQPPGSSLVLAQSRQLAAQLRTIVTRTSSTQPTPASVPTSPAPKSSATKPAATSSTSPKTSPKTSPSSAPTPSTSPSSTAGPGHIPTLGG